MSDWQRHLRPTLAPLSAYDVPPAPARARLHANECPEPWPAEVMDAVAEAVRGVELGRYPDTSARSLRALLGELHGCDPARVVLGNGSDEVISFLMTALSGPLGREAAIVLPRPTFVMYAHSARVMGLDVREVDLDEDFQLDGPALRAALGDPRVSLCFFARPNNPTGTLFDAALIFALVREFPAVVFVIDEAYIAYAPEASLWRPDLPGNVVFMTTVSKVGLAALRVGYCIAPLELARALDKVRHPYNISQTSIVVAETILTRFTAIQEAMLQRARANRTRLSALLGRLPGATVVPSSANLVLVRVGTPARAAELRATLAARGILVKDASGPRPLGGCLRVSVGTGDELDLLEAAIADVADTG